MKNYIILTLASILIMVVILLFVLIKDNNSTTLKCRSYETAMNVLSNPEDKEVFKKGSAPFDLNLCPHLPSAHAAAERRLERKRW